LSKVEIVHLVEQVWENNINQGISVSFRCPRCYSCCYFSTNRNCSTQHCRSNTLFSISDKQIL